MTNNPTNYCSLHVSHHEKNVTSPTHAQASRSQQWEKHDFGNLHILYFFYRQVA